MPNWTPSDFALYERRRSGGVSTPQNKPPTPPSPVSVPKNSLSTDEEKLNKTEKAYLAYLRLTIPDAWIGVQNLTLKLGHDVRYTPDLIVVRDSGGIEAHEVKGYWRDDAKVKIRVAARLFPWIAFWVVMKGDAGWKYERVKP